MSTVGCAVCVSGVSVSAALSVVPICGCTTEPDTHDQKNELFLT